jgi:septal ring factor EnvC (AmiA/AmiB activator)
LNQLFEKQSRLIKLAESLPLYPSTGPQFDTQRVTVYSPVKLTQKWMVKDMAIMTLGKAAKQWNLARGTVYAAAKNGKLSVSKNSQGHYQVDAAEMSRVYGQPKAKEQPQKEQQTTIATDLMQKQIDMLERQLKEAKEREDRLNNQIDQLNARLEHQKTNDNEQPRQKKKWLLGRVVDAVLDN